MVLRFWPCEFMYQCRAEGSQGSGMGRPQLPLPDQWQKTSARPSVCLGLPGPLGSFLRALSRVMLL